MRAEHAEREALQRRLAESERFEALGQLAGGVAHDFNNLLTVVAGNNALMADSAGHIPDVAEGCKSIEAAAERGALLVRQLLAFARRQPSAPKSLDLEAQTKNLLPLLEPLAGKQVRVRLETSGPSRVLIDPTQFDQILMNLVIFEPFFTTKAEHGTGLGLATVLRATREASGTISVDSTPGEGTAFRISLPAEPSTWVVS